MSDEYTGKNVRLVFGYTGGEKSVISAKGISKADVHAIAESIANSTKQMILLDIPTTKSDVILVNRAELIFFYATPYDEDSEKHPR